MKLSITKLAKTIKENFKDRLRVESVSVRLVFKDNLHHIDTTIFYYTTENCNEYSNFTTMLYFKDDDISLSGILKKCEEEFHYRLAAEMIKKEHLLTPQVGVEFVV